MAATDGNTKNKALKAVADALDKNRDAIIAANKADLIQSEEENLAAPLLKRLKFDGSKIDGVIDGINSLIGLEEPVGITQMAKET